VSGRVIEPMSDDTPTPDLLIDALLAFFAGRGPWGVYAAYGLHTYPDGEGEANRAIHAACLELEKRGVIERSLDTPSHVAWKAIHSET
jgi:hypothetical protein